MQYEILPGTYMSVSRVCLGAMTWDAMSPTAYAALARRRGLTLVQLALGYVASRWFTGAAIIGATTMAQLKEDIAAAQFTLDRDTLEDIKQIQLRYPNPAA